MKFSLPEIHIVNTNNEVCVGNVYRCQGGRAGSLRYMYIIAAISDRDSCSCLQIDTNGNIVGCTTYAAHYLREKQVIAFCEDLETLTLNVLPYNGF